MSARPQAIDAIVRLLEQCYEHRVGRAREAVGYLGVEFRPPPKPDFRQEAAVLLDTEVWATAEKSLIEKLRKQLERMEA